MNRAEIDFHGSGREPGEVNAVGLGIGGREAEAGAAPIVAGGGEIAHGDEDSFDANYAHDHNPAARLSPVNAGCHRRRIVGGESRQGILFASF